MSFLLKYQIIGRNQFLRFYSSRKKVRVRFAPSPTGYLHLGGLRTALYNFLFARAHKGKFILRIEDTDQTRLIPGAVEQIQDDLEWLQLIPDEGPRYGGPLGPYTQSERKELYKQEVDKLISSGAAYYCFCTERRLDLLRRDAVRNRQVPKYDNHCRNLSKEEINSKLSSGIDKCVRFKLVPSEPFGDLVYGRICHDVVEIEGDPIVQKSDGWPTYHLANVVDDKFMDISHVIRGVEWMQSTNKHLMIYRALGYEPPQFAHLPLILNKDGSKLSKRQGDLSLRHLRERGIMANGLLNFIIQAGTGFKNVDSNFSLQQLIEEFDLNSVSTNSTKLPLERMDEFNRLELMRKTKDDVELNLLVSEVKQLVKNTFSKMYKNDNLELDDEHIKTILIWSLPRINSLNDLISGNLRFLWVKPNLETLHNTDGGADILLKLENELATRDFEPEVLKVFLRQFSEKHKIPFKDLMSLMRTSLSELKQGPSVAEMLLLLGKDASLKRFERAYNLMNPNYKQTSTL